MGSRRENDEAWNEYAAEQEEIIKELQDIDAHLFGDECDLYADEG